MKITGTRSYIEIEDSNRILTITGELTLDNKFYADEDSITNWKNLDGSTTKIYENEKAEIISQIKKISTNKNNLKVIFE